MNTRFRFAIALPLALQPMLAFASDPTGLAFFLYLFFVVVPFFLISALVSVIAFSEGKYRRKEFASRQAEVSTIALSISLFVSLATMRSIQEFFEIFMMVALPISVFVALPFVLHRMQRNSGN